MLDELDRKILTHLSEDGRKPYREIADSIDTTPVTVTNRINRMKDEGVIKNYTIKLDHDKIGYDLSAKIELKLHGERSELRERLEDHPNIASMYRVTGKTDILIIGKFEDKNDMSEFVKDDLLDTHNDLVKNASTQIIMDTYKEETASPVPDMENN
ncbi:MAG: Lrp/AsnC family transcriptional regulator [Candidatus Nanohaloarchaea archaeon]|nr:Lrp/AsnC family transcriptional regulator [Candidatus Nanohaloarchaea archaeon]